MAWHEISLAEKEQLTTEAKRTAPCIRSHGRSPEVHLDDTYVGLCGELGYAAIHEALDLWWKHRRSVSGKSDDGGDDMPGVAIKTIRSGSQYCITGDDDRPRFYVIMEYQVFWRDGAVRARVREFGNFPSHIVGDHTLPNGEIIRGVRLDDPRITRMVG